MELEKILTFNIGKEHCEFRTIHESDVNQSYIKGLREQKQYIEHIPDNATISSQKNYIYEVLKSKGDTICGLFLNGELVATAGVQLSFSESFLQGIMPLNGKLATIGIFVFNKNYRGMGLGKALVWASAYLFHECTQTKGYGAGMEKENVASYKPFLDCGIKKFYEDEKFYKVYINYKQLIKPGFLCDVELYENI